MFISKICRLSKLLFTNINCVRSDQPSNLYYFLMQKKHEHKRLRRFCDTTGQIFKPSNSLIRIKKKNPKNNVTNSYLIEVS